MKASMLPQHAETIENIVAHFGREPGVAAVLLVGSIAHGFAGPASDVDIALLVSDEERAERAASNRLVFVSQDLATYERGYVDGKYISRTFLDAVEQRGSEPARYAFAHARIVHGSVPGLAEQLERIARYPVAEKTVRMQRFCAQMQAWNWYVAQAAQRDDAYLLNLAISKLSLFAGRLILAHNELLFPYHKWFFRVLEQAPDQPEGFVEALRQLNRVPSAPAAATLYELVKSFRAWPNDSVAWPDRFLQDSELTWLAGQAPIDDL
jgi:predicted nucleotidyltransferase